MTAAASGLLATNVTNGHQSEIPRQMIGSPRRFRFLASSRAHFPFDDDVVFLGLGGTPGEERASFGVVADAAGLEGNLRAEFLPRLAAVLRDVKLALCKSKQLVV